MYISTSSYYPISIEKIISKIEKKQKKHSRSLERLDNIKEYINKYGEKIKQIDGEIPKDLEIINGDRFLFISYDQSILTHGLHKYPAKFFPELPRWLIKRYSKRGDMILDPFMGSGTTNVEAFLNSRHSVGIDIDPFSRFLSKVKTTPLLVDELNFVNKYLLRAMVNYKPTKVEEKDIPTFPYRDNWFNKEIILELAYIKKRINSLDVSINTKNFLKICFSSIIRSVSNADNNCTRTVIRKKLNKQVLPSDALKKFVHTILINTPKVIEFSKMIQKNVSINIPEDQDARELSKYPDNYFDLAVTSPPYVNAVDYPRTHQLELYWLGFASDSLVELKRKHIGSESVFKKDYQILKNIHIDKADIVISKIFEKDPRRAFIAYKYLIDMKINLIEVYRTLKKGGRYIIVVGNNKIRNELFENWKYLIEIANNIGYDTELYFGSEIIKHFIKVPREERINTDWLIVLRK